MARFGVGDADKYGGQGGGGYFRLDDDGDVAQVRFLYNSIADVEGVSVHELKEYDDKGKIKKKTYVECLREYGDPVEVCPFCAAKGFDAQFAQVKYFVPLYNIKEKRIQTWERGKKFGQKITSICARYAKEGVPLVSHIFEIERNGAKGEQTTQYEIYETEHTEGVTLADFDKPDTSNLTLQKTADDMECYLNAGYFPGTGRSNDSYQPVRRGGRDEASDERRRTPNGGRREVY